MFKKSYLVASMAFLLTSPAWAKPLPVVASFSILGDMVREVGGERVHVENLVGPDQDAHVYQPTPQDVKKLAGAKMFVVNGLEFEGWLNRLQSSSGYKGRTVVASNGILALEMGHNHAHNHDHTAESDGHHDHHHHGEFDPHAWHDVGNAVIYVKNITRALIRLDPIGKNYYEARSQKYIETLKALDKTWSAEMSKIPVADRKAITSHEAFNYLARKYKIRFLSPQGISTEADATPRQVANLVQQIRRENIRALFVENMSQPRLLEQISKETGVNIGGKLYSDALSKSDQANTYVKMMNYNLNVLIEGLKKN